MCQMMDVFMSVFFVKSKTAYESRIRDWSSDGCSSDLRAGFYDGEAGLGPAERAGREVWYKATAGNARFHAYVFQQHIGILVDWFRVLRADRHGDRFRAWGVINDPDCCIPGSDG